MEYTLKFAVILESPWSNRELKRCDSEREAMEYICDFFHNKQASDTTLSIKRVYIAKAA